MYQPAKEPNDLERLFVERANAGDLEGLLALYEPDAALVNDEGEMVVGRDQIRKFLAGFLAARPKLSAGVQASPVRAGDLALTSTRLESGDITAEIARRQPDGNWLWVVDHFALLTKRELLS